MQQQSELIMLIWSISLLSCQNHWKSLSSHDQILEVSRCFKAPTAFPPSTHQVVPLWATLIPRCARTRTKWCRHKTTKTIRSQDSRGWQIWQNFSVSCDFIRVTDICCNVTKVRHLLLRHLEIMAVRSWKDSHCGLSFDLLRTGKGPNFTYIHIWQDKKQE